jgi:hypothetical protein
LPFKFYANAGWEFAFSSYIAEDNAALARVSGRPIPDPSFAKIPMSAGLELKTFNTDFFLELEADPFLANIAALGRSSKGWVRYRMIGKTFDHSLWESPAWANIGGRMKYANGLQLQGGLAWLLSADIGPSLGPCQAQNNPCKQGATDGYSPFYPQWRVFGMIRYPIRFTQPSSELYRSLLLHRYQDKDKRVDVEKALNRSENNEDGEERNRRLRIEERRREADEKAVDLD